MEEETGAATYACSERAADAARQTRMSRAAGLEGVGIGGQGKGKVEETNSKEELDKTERGGV